MGWGQGQGLQAGTSRVQGRVLAITPPTRPVDQSSIHGMFLLSPHGKGYYLIQVHHIHSSLHHLYESWA